MEKSKRKEREFQTRRAEILDCAEKIFSAKGFHNTTVAEVAGSAGFAVGTLYQFFESKEQLYSQMFQEKFERMLSEIDSAVNKKKGFPEKISALVETHFNIAESNSDFLQLFLRAGDLTASDGNVSVQRQIIAFHFKHIQFVEEIIRSGVRSGHLRTVDPKTIATALLGIINALKFNWLVSQDKDPLHKKAPLVLDLFLKGIAKNDA